MTSAKEEFEAMVRDVGKMQALAKLAFDQIDESRSSFLSPKEWKGLLHLVSQELGFSLIDSEAEELFREVDTNGDGRISFEEFSLFFGALVKQVSDEVLR